MFIFNTISLIFYGKEVNLDAIVNNLYNEIIKEINPKNIFKLELIVLKNDDLDIELIEDYISIKSITKKKSIEYKKNILNNEKE